MNDDDVDDDSGGDNGDDCNDGYDGDDVGDGDDYELIIRCDLHVTCLGKLKCK